MKAAWLRGSLAILACLLVSRQADAQRGPLQRTADHERLGFLLGDWDTALLQADGSVLATGQATYEWEVGGVWLVQRYRIEFPGIGVRHERGLWTFDASAKAVVGVWVDNLSGGITTFSGGWADDETLVLHLPDRQDRTGDRISMDVTVARITPDEIHIVQRQARNGGTPVPVARVRMKRR